MLVNAKELRQHLSEYLERAARGHTLDISMRGKAIARLSGIEPRAVIANDDLFGIWADDKGEMDIESYMRELRQGRRF